MKKTQTKVAPKTAAKVAPANNANHWKDWQKRHRAPRPIDLLRMMHNARAEQLRQSPLQTTLDELPDEDIQTSFGKIDT